MTTAEDDVYAYKRSLDDNDVIVMLNFSESDKDFTIPSGLPSGKFLDVLTGKVIDFASSTQFYLPSLGASVFIRK